MAKRYRRKKRKSYKRRRTTKRYGRYWKINKPQRNPLRGRRPLYSNARNNVPPHVPIPDNLANMDNTNSLSAGDLAHYGMLAAGGALAANFLYKAGSSALRYGMNPAVRQAYFGRGDGITNYERNVLKKLDHQKLWQQAQHVRVQQALDAIENPPLRKVGKAAGLSDLPHHLKDSVVQQLKTKSRKQHYEGQSKDAAIWQQGQKVMAKAAETLKKSGNPHKRPLTRHALMKARQEQVAELFNRPHKTEL
ncbi:hypothetical protein [Crucivirus-536]|nr:hypothetical protein [Crucivirus-536]